MYFNIYFFGSDAKWAFHIFPEYYKYKEYHIENIGAGFVLSFKSKKDDKTIINAEPYIKFNDIENRYNSKLATPATRNEIGLRIGLPISPPKF